jgi:hypothetical protein
MKEFDCSFNLNVVATLEATKEVRCISAELNVLRNEIAASVEFLHPGSRDLIERAKTVLATTRGLMNHTNQAITQDK